MEKTDPTEFISKAKFHFRFLDNYGFKIVSEKILNDACEVLWTNPNANVYVLVALAPPQFEAQLSFGRIGIDDQRNAYSFEPGDLIQLETCRTWTWKRGSSADIYLEEFARLLLTCGKPCLEGDQVTFARMKAKRQQLITTWVTDEKAHATREQANIAWARQDYREVLRLYGSLDRVSEIEQKRILIAERHLSSRSA